MKRFALVVALFMPFAGIGCGTAENSNVQEFEELDGKADTVLPEIGTYWNHQNEVKVGELHMLLLKSDRTYNASMKKRCVDPVGWKCLPVELEGSYKFTRAPGGRRYIRLMDNYDSLLARFEYVVGEDGWLNLKNTSGKNAQSFDLNRATDSAEAWCDEEQDCGLQGLVEPDCFGSWKCNSLIGYDIVGPCSGFCSFECEAFNSCQAAGGECVPVYPGSCDGIIGDSQEYSCGGGLGTMCCLPGPVAPVCDQIGTDEEGWYHGNTGEKICTADCAGAVAICDAIGSRSEGWYAESGNGCRGGRLIGWENCGSSSDE